MSKNYAGGLLTANQNANFSGLFNGSNSYLSVAGASRFAIATSTTPFTIEAWVRPTAAGSLIFSEEFTSDNIAMAFGLATSNDISAPAGLFPVMGYYLSGAWTNVAASTTALVLNAWAHVAFVFTGSTSKIYINGIDVTKTSAPTPATTWGLTGNNGTNWFVGRRWDTSANVYFKGNISNFRFVNGTPVYTGNFAPPARLSAITNTVLLTCQSSTFVDNSSFAATVTNTGGTVVSQDNPFYAQPYDPSLGVATPGVWTISEAAAAAGNRSWNMYDPYFNLTTAMIHGNGANGANNNTFLDSSTNNFTVTRAGNTTQGTFTPYSEPNGYWSNFFDGTGDYLTVTGSSNLAFATGDFTIECLFYLTALPNPNAMLYDARPAADGAYPCLFVAVTTNILTYYVSTASRITGTTPLRVGQWYHVVVSRVSGNTRMFLNGAQEGATYVDATNYLNGTSRPLIGNNGLNLNGLLTGHISNLRVLKGTGVTSVTVPTAPLTAVTNTQLLTCQSNRFVDNSANNFTITRNGDVRTLTYSPFYSPTAYTPQARGGGMYFDGTGDYLTTPSNAAFDFWAGNFTFECWFYPTNATNLGNCVYFSTGSAATGINFGNSGSSTLLYSNQSGGVVLISGTQSTLNSWNHIALTKSGSTFAVFINGVRIGTSTSTLYPTGNQSAFIGANSANSAQVIAGYLSNARLVKGTAVYDPTLTTLTIPTAPLTPITNTQLLLSGTNGSFIDNATNLTVETINATITTSQNKYGVGSMLFNGSTAYASLITPAGNGASVVPTLGDFTVEGWVYPITANAQKAIFFLNGNTSSFGVRIDHTSSGAIQLLVSTTGAAHAINVIATTVLSTGRWTHIALVRAGPSFNVYFNGTSIITSTAVGITTAVMAGTLSYLGVLGGLANYFFGAMSDFRITNYARYLGNFTPPTSMLQNQ
jgi:hypothetical protein